MPLPLMAIELNLPDGLDDSSRAGGKLLAGEFSTQ